MSRVVVKTPAKAKADDHVTDQHRDNYSDTSDPHGESTSMSLTTDG